MARMKAVRTAMTKGALAGTQWHGRTLTLPYGMTLAQYAKMVAATLEGCVITFKNGVFLEVGLTRATKAAKKEVFGKVVRLKLSCKLKPASQVVKAFPAHQIWV